MNQTCKDFFSYIVPHLLIILFKIIEKEQVTILDLIVTITVPFVQAKLIPVIGLVPGALVGAILFVAIKKPETTTELILAATSPTEHGKAILLRHDDEYIPIYKGKC